MFKILTFLYALFFNVNLEKLRAVENVVPQKRLEYLNSIEPTFSGIDLEYYLMFKFLVPKRFRNKKEQPIVIKRDINKSQLMNPWFEYDEYLESCKCSVLPPNRGLDSLLAETDSIIAKVKKTKVITVDDSLKLSALAYLLVEETI
jgi:hypothetical protein